MNLPAPDTPALLPLNPLATLIAGRRVDAEAAGGSARVVFQVTADWLQGRTCFGGLIAALAVQAMRDIAGAHWPAEVSLRALQTSFVGPVAQGLFDVQVQLLREGKNLRQVQATVRQDGQTAAVLLGVFGSDRPSSLRQVRLQQPPASHPPGQLPMRRVTPGTAPEFLRHFDLRWDHGPMPGSGGAGLDTRIHMRLLNAAGLSDELVCVMLADTPPTPAIGQLTRPAPSSSVTWALELRPLRQRPAADGWWRCDNESLVVDGGFVNHAARLWAPSGELAALGYQVVTVYA